MKGGRGDKVPPVSRYVSSHVAVAVRRRSFRRASCPDVGNIDEPRSPSWSSFFLFCSSARLIAAHYRTRYTLPESDRQLPDTPRGISTASSIAGTTSGISFHGLFVSSVTIIGPLRMIYDCRERNEGMILFQEGRLPMSESLGEGN
jgi:hypothetical protein